MQMWELVCSLFESGDVGIWSQQDRQLNRNNKCKTGWSGPSWNPQTELGPRDGMGPVWVCTVHLDDVGILQGKLVLLPELKGSGSQITGSGSGAVAGLAAGLWAPSPKLPPSTAVWSPANCGELCFHFVQNIFKFLLWVLLWPMCCWEVPF